MKKYLKSVVKGAKYAGLVVAAGGLAGVGDVVPNLVSDVLGKAGVPELVVSLVVPYATPFLAGALAAALHQVVKHRDEIFPAAEPE